MLTTIQGVYRHGKIELTEKPVDVSEETLVLVTFLTGSRSIDLRTRGINQTEAATLRTQLASFAEDWDSEEMSVYDDYNTAKASL